MATRRPLLAGNWKMHGTRSETERLLSALTQALGGVDPAQREIVVAPPFSVLETAARLLADTPIRLAAQNLHWEPHGAFTGEVSGSPCSKKPAVPTSFSAIPSGVNTSPRPTRAWPARSGPPGGTGCCRSYV